MKKPEPIEYTIDYVDDDTETTILKFLDKCKNNVSFPTHISNETGLNHSTVMHTLKKLTQMNHVNSLGKKTTVTQTGRRQVHLYQKVTY